MTEAHVEIEVGGERLRLLGDRAIHWPARGRLLIADLHLGKGDLFRRAGIGLPSGGTAQDLQRLDTLLERTDASELWILGDMVHGPIADAPWLQQWMRWRHRHAKVGIRTVSGNHDRALPRVAGTLGVELSGPRVVDGSILLRHEPLDSCGHHVLCGHLHPCIAVPGVSRRWPAFWLRRGMTVLPAFSAFTGGPLVPGAPGDRIAACVEGSIIWIPALKARTPNAG